MWNKVKGFFRRIGVKMGLIQEIAKLTEHRKINADSVSNARILKNKKIYQGEADEITYLTSNGREKTRKPLTLNMGKVIAHEMATLVFNEKAIINIKNQEVADLEQSLRDSEQEFEPLNDEMADFINEILASNNFHSEFQRYLEYGFALGGFVIKPYWNGERIKIGYATADTFIPLSWDNDDILEAVFINQERKDENFYTLLEWHEWDANGEYTITNELYESTSEERLGVKVSLSTLYKDLEPTVKVAGLERPLFVYIKPNTANNKDMQSPLGISIYDNSHDTLELIDYMYDYLLQELKLGKRRIGVDQSMLKPVIDEHGNIKARFDEEETVFVNVANGEGRQSVVDMTVGLRNQQIIDSINSCLEILANQIGFSSGTFTFDKSGLKTATEVVSENSRTYQTRNAHCVIIEQGIKDLVDVLVDMAVLYYDLAERPEMIVTVDFDDSIAEDRQSNYLFYSRAYLDGLLPKKEALKRVWKISDEEAEEWLAELEAEQTSAMLTDDLLDLVGTPSFNMEDDREGLTERFEEE